MSVTKKHNSTIDVLKGISIIMVLITHYAWNDTQRLNPLFPFLIEMAVPIFMILSGYVGALSFHIHHIDSFSDAYETRELLRKVLRYTIPFIIIVLSQLLDPNVVTDAQDLLERLRWFLNGTVGQGSYYYPILIQMIFIFPIIYFVIESKGKNGLGICLAANAAYELLKWSYGMNDECYRLLVFRYIFVIAAGIYAYQYDMEILESVILIVIGCVFIALTAYGIYTPRIITSWTGTSFVAVMWIVPITIYLIRKVDLHVKLIEILGRASYNIFLVQMVYYRSYRSKLIPLIKQWQIELWVSVVICIVAGIMFYKIERRVTGYVTKKALIT